MATRVMRSWTILRHSGDVIVPDRFHCFLTRADNSTFNAGDTALMRRSHGEDEAGEEEEENEEK